MGRLRKHPMPPSAGDRLRDARRARGLTQVQLAASAGVHPNTVSDLERGRLELTPAVVLKLAAALGISPATLLPGLPWDGGATIRVRRESGTYRPEAESDREALGRLGVGGGDLAELARAARQAGLALLILPGD